jgi:uncharacterized membrane protein YidH (DUF202 family)
MSVKFIEHKLMPWANKKCFKNNKLRYADSSEPDSAKLKTIIERAIDIAKESKDEHPVISDIIGLLLKINGILMVIAGCIRVLAYHGLYSFVVNSGISSAVTKDKTKLKEALDILEKAIPKLKDSQKQMARQVAELTKIGANPKLFLLKGILGTILIMLGAYISFATASFLRAQKQIEQS